MNFFEFFSTFFFLGFEGLNQVNGSSHPVHQVQAEWFASILSRESRLPSPQAMQEEIEEWKVECKNKNLNLPMTVDQHRYIEEIKSLIKDKSPELHFHTLHTPPPNRKKKTNLESENK